MALTIYDVAKRAGYSHTAVSATLNGRGDRAGIGKKAQSKIIRIANEMGYRRNALASAMAGGLNRVVGMVVSNPYKEWIGQTLQGALAVAGARDYLIKIVSTEELEQSLPTVLDKFLEQRISGAFLIDFDAISQEDVALIKTDPGLRELDLTYSNCDRALPGLRIDADDYDGGRQVVEHLIELGHRKIGYVGPIGTDTSSSHVRWEGFSDTLEKVGLPITDKLLHDVDWVPPPTQSLRADWLKDTKAARKARPTALLCANDQIACRVIRHARRHNIRVPQDLSVVGFSDELMGRFVDPPLTSVSQNRYDMGRAAIERLIDQHEARDGGLADPPRKPRNGRSKTVKRGKPILTPVKLVIRDSTGPVPDTA